MASLVNLWSAANKFVLDRHLGCCMLNISLHKVSKEKNFKGEKEKKNKWVNMTI